MCIRDRWGKKSTSSWIKEVQKDLENNNIHAEEAIEREVFRAKVLKMEGVQGRREKNEGSNWSEDRKKRLSEKIDGTSFVGSVCNL